MPRDNNQGPLREYEGNSQVAAYDFDERPDDLDLRAEEARELDRNPVKHDEYQEDVAAEMEDLDGYQGPDA